MDLQLFAKVLMRHRRIAFTGLALAFALALLAMVKVSSAGVAYRHGEVWQNRSTLLLTQSGFPEGRSVFPSSGRAGAAVPTSSSAYADPNRFSGLTTTYAALASSDAVIERLRNAGLITDSELEKGKLPVSASSISDPNSGDATPLIGLVGKAKTPGKATALTLAATDALLSYIQERQAEANIPLDQRVEIRVVQKSERPMLVEPRKKTMAIIVFLAVLTSTVVLVFLADNAQRSRERAALEGADVIRPVVETAEVAVHRSAKARRESRSG